MSECNCYHGMDCSKITVCAAEGMVENAVEELEAQLDSVLEENRLLKGQLDAVRDPAERIKQWCEAYPLDIFPEPDFKLARKGLESVGITMDAVSASCMRRVVDGISKYADQLQQALGEND